MNSYSRHNYPEFPRASINNSPSSPRGSPGHILSANQIHRNDNVRNSKLWPFSYRASEIMLHGKLQGVESFARSFPTLEARRARSRQSHVSRI
ncbi:hypothetical protein PUN28_004835 [Cardiocondyla obscurior]|uniref:Uncharacterized protein n=1 Tax=Cardiocondyla obscurior TaxID=286306 RepID=A0AAW2GFT9_9HYME